MRIVWSLRSIAQLENIRDYIARDSEHYAASVIGRIVDAVEKLLGFPKRGREVPEADDPDVRELLFQGYRILYQVRPHDLHILAVLHGSRELAGMDPKPWDVH